jgi:hypothetical protein
MSSPNIVQGIRVLIQNKLMSAVPKKWHPQLRFGLQAYGLQAFQSASGNARRVVTNSNTAARKSERLLANVNLAVSLGTVFDTLGLIRPSSYVNVDHSDMNGLTALVGALQTRNGRAIPCFVETTYSDRLPAHNHALARKQRLRAARKEERVIRSFTGHTIDSLQDFHDRLGFWPKGLVFDRGFGNESIITHLAAEGATFYVRLKAGRYVELSDDKTITRLAVKALRNNDSTIQLFGMTLRVIRSPKGRRSPEPWYILTNDFTKTRASIVTIYYHRFEIEESFKDVKHIFEFRRTRLNKPASLRMILWCIFLGIALLYSVTKPMKCRAAVVHPKKRRSWIRSAMEQLYQAFGLVLWGEVG